MDKYEFTIDRELDGLRVDIAGAKAEVGLSRRKAKQIIDLGGCYINRKRVRIASKLVHVGDSVSFEYHEASVNKIKTSSFEFKSEDILFEDDTVIAINKPAGVPSQATRTQAVFHVVALLEKFMKTRDGSVGRLDLVHRLDKETTGVLLIAKGKTNFTFYSNLFRDRKVTKVYHALSYGVIDKKFELENILSPISKNSGRVSIVGSLKNGKTAKTKFSLLEAFNGDYSLVKCMPYTGRSHQLRVHLDSVGNSIVGDKVYGDKRKAKGAFSDLTYSHHFLHAYSLTFPLKNGGAMTVCADYPKNFSEFISKIRG